MTASSTRKAASAPKFPYTSRLQKGGALLEDMRQLVRTWTDEPIEEQRETGIRSNILNKQTRKRLADVYRRAFLPRFVNGPIPNAWKLVRPLEDEHAPIHILRPVYYWITANAEPLLGDFCREVLLTDYAARPALGTEDVLRWMTSKSCPWSIAAATRVARSLLAALRDFGILEGRARKRLAPRALPVESFAYLAFCFRLNGISSSALLSCRDWQLFLLDSRDVEHLFLLAHQEGLLDYQAAGSMFNLNFPAASVEDYAHAIAERSL